MCYHMPVPICARLNDAGEKLLAGGTVKEIKRIEAWLRGFLDHEIVNFRFIAYTYPAQFEYADPETKRQLLEFETKPENEETLPEALGHIRMSKAERLKEV